MALSPSRTSGHPRRLEIQRGCPLWRQRRKTDREGCSGNYRTCVGSRSAREPMVLGGEYLTRCCTLSGHLGRETRREGRHRSRMSVCVVSHGAQQEMPRRVSGKRFQTGSPGALCKRPRSFDHKTWINITNKSRRSGISHLGSKRKKWSTYIVLLSWEE